MAKLSKVQSKEITLAAGKFHLQGSLSIPQDATSLVLFAHGSGSSRHSPRNQAVAKVFNEGKLATLLMDLLTNEEEQIDMQTRHLRFDIFLLAQRLIEATNFLQQNEETKNLHIGYFGSSTGAAAALVAAAQKGAAIGAVVSRGGRPDLAASSLPKVISPTLLIVGGNDFEVLRLNQQALELLNAEKKLDIVPHATHLFEEPGALEEVARLANWWFTHYL